MTCFGPARARFDLTANHPDVATSVERFFKPWWNPKTLIAEHADAATSTDQPFIPWSMTAPTEDAKPTAHVSALVDRRLYGLVPTYAASATALLFPATHPTVVPAFPDPPRTVHEGDVLLSAPDGDDPLGLRPQHPAVRRTTAHRLVQALTALPHHTIDLTRGVPTAVRCLDELAGTF